MTRSSLIAPASHSGVLVVLRMVLVVGETDSPCPPQTADAVTFAAIGDLRPAMFVRRHFDLVIAPLISRSFDGIDLAGRLDRLGYQGILRLLTPALPAPDIVRRELCALCPAITVELVQTEARLGLSPRR